VAALLTGARFTLETPEAVPPMTPDPADVVETVKVANESPLLGLAPNDVVEQMGSDAVVPGVICGATPQLVETDERRGVQAGDKARRRGSPWPAGTPARRRVSCGGVAPGAPLRPAVPDLSAFPASRRG
jgi:hypothetical protein